MADRKGATPPAPPEDEAPQVPTTVAGPPLPEPERTRIWSEVELVVGALREHWTEAQQGLAAAHEAARKAEEVTDNA